MKNTVWTFPYWIHHYPPSGPGTEWPWIPRIMEALYIIIWIITIKMLYRPVIRKPIIYGFIFGLFLKFILYLWSACCYDFAFNKTTNRITLYKSNIDFRILYKSPFNEELRKNYKKGYILDPVAYNNYVKRGEIDDKGLTDEVHKKRHEEKEDANTSLTPFTNLTLTSYYIVILMFSLSILVNKFNIKIFRLMFPWIGLGTLFTLIQAASYFWTPDIATSSSIYVIKSRLFVIGCSFFFTAILIVLRINNL